MKYLRMFAHEVIAAAVVFLALARPLVAQQEVSPDHFDSAAVRNKQTATTAKTDPRNSLHVYRSGKRNSRRTAPLHTAAASVKPNRKG